AAHQRAGGDAGVPAGQERHADAAGTRVRQGRGRADQAGRRAAGPGPGAGPARPAGPAGRSRHRGLPAGRRRGAGVRRVDAPHRRGTPHRGTVCRGTVRTAAGRPVTAPARRPTPGPLGAVLWYEGEEESTRLVGAGAGSNARVVLNRTAFQKPTGEMDPEPVLAWAAQHRLGQVAALVSAVDARRVAALRKLAAQGYAVRRLRVRPQWRLAVGHGDHATAYETGLSLHGTYGWPCLPGSSLKGLADAYARDAEAGPVSRADRAYLFGA